MDSKEISVVQGFPTDGDAKKVGKSWLGKKLKKGKAADAPKEERRINGYVLGETLGMGGYSKVKLGWSEKRQETVALKIMFADASGEISASKRKQLTRELHVMGKVQHKNVIQLIEYDDEARYPASKDKELPCILVVLEFAPGGELFDYLMFTGKFDERATRAYFHQFLDGLEAIHACGICHRDLKPENLLLDAHCNLKIADFGFATEFISEDGLQSKMQTACGTKGYLSPELLKGKKYTHKCDIFAVGIIMFTTYAGFPPFQNAVESDWWWDKLNKGWKYYEQSRRLDDPAEADKHFKASRAKKELFWKAHERSCKFSRDFKHMIEYCLHPMPTYRFDIADIRADPWFVGAQLHEGTPGMYDQAGLKKFLLERVGKVKKERVEKIRKQLHENPKQLVSGMDFGVRGAGAKAAGVAADDDADIFQKVMKENPRIPMFDAHVAPADESAAPSASPLAARHMQQSLYNFRTRFRPSDVAARVNLVASLIHAEISNDPKNCAMLVNVSIKFPTGDEKQPDFFSEKVKFHVKISLTDEVAPVAPHQPAAPVHHVAFKRLFGSHQAYKQAVETFYYYKDIVLIMM